MVLKTTSDIPFTSPLAGKTARGSQDEVALKDLSGQPVHHIRARALHGGPDAVGDVAEVDGGVLARVAHDAWILLGEPESVTGESRITITDVTHGRGHMLLTGARAADVLPKVCGLDFSDEAFPDRYAAHGSLAKVRALLLRLDEGATPAYHILVASSFAAYVWDVVDDAMGEFLRGE